jgi:hypothetical protein
MFSKIIFTITVLLLTACFGFGHIASTGVSTTTDQLVTSELNYTTLLSSTFTLTKHNHHCSVIASSQTNNPGGGTVDNRYVFYMNVNGAIPYSYARTIEFDDNVGVDDVGTIEVSSTGLFRDLPPGTYTVKWQAAKETEADANMTVTTSSMSIICTKAKLQ